MYSTITAPSARKYPGLTWGQGLHIPVSHPVNHQVTFMKIRGTKNNMSSPATPNGLPKCTLYANIHKHLNCFRRTIQVRQIRRLSRGAVTEEAGLTCSNCNSGSEVEILKLF